MNELQVSINFVTFQIHDKLLNILSKHLDILSTGNKSVFLWLSVGSNPISSLSTSTPRKTTHKSPKLGEHETVGATHTESSVSQTAWTTAALTPVGSCTTQQQCIKMWNNPLLGNSSVIRFPWKQFGMELQKPVISFQLVSKLYSMHQLEACQTKQKKQKTEEDGRRLYRGKRISAVQSTTKQGLIKAQQMVYFSCCKKLICIFILMTINICQSLLHGCLFKNQHPRKTTHKSPKLGKTETNYK